MWIQKLCCAVLGFLLTGFATAAGSADDLSTPGPYQAGNSTVIVSRPDDSTFEALLYYPALAEGLDAPPDPSGAPYAGISFGHGWVQPPERYESTFRHLATRGFVVIATRSGLELFPSHAEYAADMSLCLTALESLNSGGSALAGLIDVNAFGLSGHSMGGGASILAAAADARVRVVANLAAAETNPSAIAAMGTIDRPVLLICGSEDAIVPPGLHGQRMYDQGRGPRQLPLILGGSHCGFMDRDAIVCDSGSLGREQQLEVTRRLLTTIFSLYLKNDQSLAAAVWGPGLDDDVRVQTQFEPNLSLEPQAVTAQACPGGTLLLPFSLSNTGALEVQYAWLVDENEWTVEMSPAQTDPVPPGEASFTTAAAYLPQGPGADADELLISARSEFDGGTRAYATVLLTRLRLEGDLNMDGRVDLTDLSTLLSGFGAPGGMDYENGDLDGDGAIDLNDLSLLLVRFGDVCQP